MVTPAYLWQGRRNRHPAESAVYLTGAGVDAAHIRQDIITETVMQRPELNGLLDVIRAVDILAATAHQEVAGGGQLVALATV